MVKHIMRAVFPNSQAIFLVRVEGLVDAWGHGMYRTGAVRM